MIRSINGATVVAGVVGRPVKHSLSPAIHNAWLAEAGLDGVYVPFGPPADGFSRFVEGLRGGVVRGLNVTLPFKEQALAAADEASAAAEAAGAANLLVFEPDGRIVADNTDGVGLLWAFRNQAPAFEPGGGVVTILGAGGAARGAAAAFILAGARQVRLVNRTLEKAEAIAQALGPDVRVFGWDQVEAALSGADALVNATSLGLDGKTTLDVELHALGAAAPVMDMVYRPLETPLLAQARRRGHPAVDGLEMLIGQAIPSFRAFFGAEPPAIDARGLVLTALGR